ncbi:hypothetical protein TraAM80_02831 [Trypanosoma rangeli]|uniref:Uncharacterized protein n=1 Tax=Trypanosoma rangeli TaxID=5698 RepID=A0A422NS07_TRYRA|nr:uncharacterized protein TraAM80_02831 [Trypanosoma rangeli]RNF08258.1 hypothetical protein TraAM80_02831 [Trypanosoma rangeli]|eukprot:RNF08258.1 hypothetical protein TraAM80_02831 [Trypanosoma rangeli]
MMDVELYGVMFLYFVASTLGQDRLLFMLIRSVGGEALKWQQLTSPPFASLSEWRADYGAVRLSTLATGCSRGDDVCSLKSQPELLHDVLHALVLLLLPAFMVL